jgi:hypothetical protein
MKTCLLFLAVTLFPNLSLVAWQPGGWVYTNWPLAYEAQSGDWYFTLESGTQWLYTYPPGSVAWSGIEEVPLSSGWSWHKWPRAYDAESNQWHSLVPADTHWATNLTTGERSLFGHPDPLLTEEISVTTTQNGNLNNQGLAIYDRDRKRHLYSVGTNIRAYDPVTGQTETVLTLEHQGRPSFLNIRDDELYFVESDEGWLLRYNMADQMLEVLQEARHTYAARDQSNLHVIFWQDGYYNSWTLRRLAMNTNSFGSATISQVEHLNLSTSRYWYTTTDGTTLMLRDAYSGSGRSDVFRFGTRDITAIHEMVLDPRTTGDHKPLVALIMEAGDQRGLYLLQVTDSDAGDLNLVTTAAGDSLHSLAFDGSYFYFINGSTDAAIYRVDMASQEVEKLIDVGVNARYINFVNHWLYFGESGSTSLHRVHPVTRQIETLN